MIKVHVNTSAIRKEKTVETDTTPMALINELELGLSGASVNLNGLNLSVTDLNSTFSALNVSDGDTVYLNIVVKADGGGGRK